MKQLFFGFLIIFTPFCLCAGDPPEKVKCDCKTNSDGIKGIGLLRQYHSMLLALEKAGQEEATKHIYNIYNLEIPSTPGPQVQDSLEKVILGSCIQIIGEKDTSKIKSFLGLAQEWRLIQSEKVRVDLKQIGISYYKARLACLAVQSRNDTIPASKNLNNGGDQGEIISELKNNVHNWKIGSIIGGALILTLIGIGLWLFKKEKNASQASRKVFEDKLNEMEAENRQLIAEQVALIESNNLLKKEKARIPYLEEASKNPEIYQPATPPPPPPPRKLYARPPSGNILFQVSDFFEPQTTPFVIEINSQDETIGKLLLVEDNTTLLQAFSMIDTLRDACELRSTGAPTSAAQLKKNEPGTVSFSDGYWTITKKIILEW